MNVILEVITFNCNLMSTLLNDDEPSSRLESFITKKKNYQHSNAF